MKFKQIKMLGVSALVMMATACSSARNWVNDKIFDRSDSLPQNTLMLVAPDENGLASQYYTPGGFPIYPVVKVEGRMYLAESLPARGGGVGYNVFYSTPEGFVDHTQAPHLQGTRRAHSTPRKTYTPSHFKGTFQHVPAESEAFYLVANYVAFQDLLENQPGEISLIMRDQFLTEWKYYLQGLSTNYGNGKYGLAFDGAGVSASETKDVLIKQIKAILPQMYQDISEKLKIPGCTTIEAAADWYRSIAATKQAPTLTKPQMEELIRLVKKDGQVKKELHALATERAAWQARHADLEGVARLKSDVEFYKKYVAQRTSPEIMTQLEKDVAQGQAEHGYWSHQDALAYELGFYQNHAEQRASAATEAEKKVSDKPTQTAPSSPAEKQPEKVVPPGSSSSYTAPSSSSRSAYRVTFGGGHERC